MKLLLPILLLLLCVGCESGDSREYAIDADTAELQVAAWQEYDQLQDEGYSLLADAYCRTVPSDAPNGGFWYEGVNVLGVCIDTAAGYEIRVVGAIGWLLYHEIGHACGLSWGEW